MSPSSDQTGPAGDDPSSDLSTLGRGEPAAGVVDPAERRAIEARLAVDPAFQMLSFDALSWIDPFSGEPVAAPFRWQDEAVRHIAACPDWRSRPSLSLAQLRQRQWLLHLREELRHDRRLRLFDDAGRWLNPVTGGWSERVRREQPTITLGCVQAMAAELAALQATPARLRPLGELLRLQAPQRRANSPVTRVHVRPSGRMRSATAGVDEAAAPAPVESWLQAVDDPPLAELAVLSRPLEQVGGDLCVVETLADGRTLLLVADAIGHGSSAAAIGRSVRMHLAELTIELTSLPTILGRLNDALADELDTGEFLTCFAACYDPRQAVLESICAGHHPALLANADQITILRRIGRTGMALGLRRGEDFRSRLQPEFTILQPGDTLLCYTDGLCESTNEHGIELGHWGATAAFIGHIERPPRRIIARMLKQLRSYNRGRFDDDLTLVVFRYLGNED